MTEGELEKLLASMDMDGTSSVDLDEFLAATVNLAILEREDNLFRAFQIFDKDGSGCDNPYLHGSPQEPSNGTACAEPVACACAAT